MIAEEIDLPRGGRPPLPAVRTCLVMNGSLHERSLLQMQHAPAPEWRVLQREHPRGAEPAQVARDNSEYLIGQLASDQPDGIFVIGGDTAFAVIAALGLPALSPIGEVVPGVPVTRLVLPDRTRDLLLITKAGGFGDPDVLCQVRRKLESDAR
jgi:uncharacterized protein YgbK (DUF1537 family)